MYVKNTDLQVWSSSLDVSVHTSAFSQGSCTPSDMYRTRTRTPALFQLIFQWILPPFHTVRLANLSPKHMSAARRDLDWSAASARLLFDGDDAILHNIVRTPSRRGHKSLPATAARFLCGRTFTHGTTSAPFLPTRCLKKLADDKKC
jgi:hypothetical protein